MKFWVYPILSLICCTGCLETRKTLYVFCWNETLHPDIIEEFQQRYECEVVQDFFDSNESMYAKIKAGAGGYDVIFPTDYFVQAMEQQDMLAPIQYDLIPNIANLDQDKLEALDIPRDDYSVPYVLSFTGLAYRKDRIEAPDSYTILSDPTLQGRVTMLNDLREVLGASLLTLGYDLNTNNPQEIQEAVDLIQDWKPNFAKFESELFKQGLDTAEFLVSQAYSSGFPQLQDPQSHIRFAFPKEGVILSNDTLAIPRDAQNITLAHEFINFLLEPQIAAKNMRKIYADIPVKGAEKFLPDAFTQNPIVFPPLETLASMKKIRYLGKDLSLYLHAWNQIKGDTPH